MTIDEAIKHAEEKAKELYCKADEDFFFDGDWGKKIHCTECAKEHEQLANWLKELKMHSWIPVKTRELSADEVKEVNEKYDVDLDGDEAWCYCSPLPEDEQKVLIFTKYGDIVLTEFCVEDNCWFDGYEDRDDVLAWMPLPKPYTEEDADT